MWISNTGISLTCNAHGGPFQTPFQHACEVEASYSLALFSEFMHMELAVDTKPEGFLPPATWIRAAKCTDQGDINLGPPPTLCPAPENFDPPLTSSSFQVEIFNSQTAG